MITGGHRIRFLAMATLAIAAACSGGGSKATTTTSSKATTRSSSSASSSSPPAAPAGFDALTVPNGDDPANFGNNVAVTSTKDNRPVVAFSIFDTETGTSRIVASTFDAKTKAFGALVDVGTATLHDAVHSVSAARDASSGTLVVAWDDSDKTIDAAKSDDDGQTWKTVTIADDTAGARFPSIAAANGKVAVAFSEDTNNVSVATGSLAATTFTVVPVPAPADGSGLRPDAPTAAAAPDGTFGVSFLLSPAAGGAGVGYWTIGSAASIVAMDSNGVQNDEPNAALAFGPKGPVVAATLCRVDNEQDACTFVSASSDAGATFAPPVAVPADTGTGPGLAMSFAVDATGRGALAYNPNSGTGEATCGTPKLAISADLASWTICSPDTDGSLGFVAGPPALAVTPDGELLVAFQQLSSAGTAPQGVLVFTLAK
jgi:hypothetical protein